MFQSYPHPILFALAIIRLNLMRQCTIVDATISAVPGSTKNEDGKRDPEMHQTKKGNQ